MWVLSAQIAWCTRHPLSGSSVQAVKASSNSFRVITGIVWVLGVFCVCSGIGVLCGCVWGGGLGLGFGLGFGT